MEGNDLPPIIIKKSKGGHGHHGGAWKVAYADFVTAMMALFIVLWVLGQSDETKQSIAHYFQSPNQIFKVGGGSGVMPGQGPSVIEMKSVTDVTIETEKEKLTGAGNEIKNELAHTEEFQVIMDNIEFSITSEGLQIELIEKGNNIFFELGSAKLNKRATEILHIIGKQLAALPNKVLVEGHTDSRPFNSGKMLGYTNYELSADRANAARRELVKGGLEEKQLDGIIGYADKRLKKPDEPLDPINRRISILVKMKERK